MATVVQETRFDLLKNELVTLSGARGHVLDCLGGMAWVTLDGDSRDVILGPGETFRIESDAPVVVSALKPSALKLRRQYFDRRVAGARSVLAALLTGSFRPWRPSPPPSESTNRMRTRP